MLSWCFLPESVSVKYCCLNYLILLYSCSVVPPVWLLRPIFLSVISNRDEGKSCLDTVALETPFLFLFLRCFRMHTTAVLFCLFSVVFLTLVMVQGSFWSCKIFCCSCLYVWDVFDVQMLFYWIMVAKKIFGIRDCAVANGTAASLDTSCFKVAFLLLLLTRYKFEPYCWRTQ